MPDKKDILSLSAEELRREITGAGLPKYRAGQIYKWLHRSFAADFSEMTDIPAALREKLGEEYAIYGCAIEKKLVSKLDGTVKYLYRLHDGEYIETVVMKYKYGLSVCVSTQVGCRMGCKFCASTLNGCVRNLMPSEILSQIYAAQRNLGERISHIVLMGMGEPLDNYDNVLKFLRLVSDENGINIGMRNISLSTCGIVPKIYDLLGEKLGLTLSVSLHAPNDKIRNALMPVSRKWSLDELLTACRRYAQESGRRVSFEYSLVHGVNDSDENANELAGRLRGMLCHVNLIPVNEVDETGLVRSRDERIRSFQNILEKRGITATVRRTLGGDINASCGQLRRKHQKEEGSDL